MDRPRIDTLLRAAARDGGCTVRDLQSHRRVQHIVEARLIFTALAKHYRYRHYEIGWALHKWRTSANYYVKRVAERKANPFFEKQINELIKSIENDKKKRI